MSPPAILNTIVLLVFLGCGKQERASVSGNVTFNGQPIAVGQIVFEPTSVGRLGIAQISNGVYTMPAAQGPSIGKYVVRITANRPTGRTAQAGRGNEKTLVNQYEQFIPARFNEQSELTAEIGGEQAIVRDFKLTSE